MHRNIKIAIAGVAIAALAAGGWYAWVEGMVPASLVKPHPRAPLPENFLTTLQNSAAVTQSLKPACVRLQLNVGREIDRMGRAGMQHQRLPGWDVITIAQVPGDGGQRVGNMTQALSALAKAGLYTMSDTEVEDKDGNKLPAKSFALTLAGWNAYNDDYCLKAGTPRVTEITEFSRVIPDKDGKRVYEVKAKYSPQEIPAWVDDPAVQSLLSPDQVKKMREPVAAGFRLQRTEEGWEVQKAEKEVPELTKAMVMDLIAKWRGGAPQACIRLPANNSGIDIALLPYAVTLFDNDTRVDADTRFLAQLQWQSRLAQLIKAGLFTSETIAANPKLNAPAGMRYALEPAYQPWLDMNDSRCLRMGEVTLEFIGLTLQPSTPPLREGMESRYVGATARLMLRVAKDAWINSVKLGLPEVEALTDAGGVPVVARLAWSEREREREWRLVGLQSPQIEPIAPRLPRAQPGSLSGRIASVPSSPLPTSAVTAGGTPAAGDVVWQSDGSASIGGRVSNQGLTVTYCCAGASSATPASAAVASGKVYAEFTFTARPRALKGDTWTTIGVMPATDARGNAISNVMPSTPTMAFKRGDEIAHNDVIGIAVDMDAGMVYFSRNGAWLNAQPGAGGGVPLERGKQYRITAVLSASSSTAGTDSWTANFGKTKFRHALPRGFKSYDGRQRG
jgi:hypothetical protein